MPRFRVIQAEVEAFALEDGRMVVVAANDELKVMPADQFTQLFEAVPDRRAKAERRAKPRTKKVERRTVIRATKKVITGQELAERAAVAVRADRHPERDRARELWEKQGKSMHEIEKLTKVTVANLYYWKKADGWKDRPKATAATKAAAPADDGWMA